MSTSRVLSDVNDKRVVERHKFVSETRKDVILSKRQEARLYKVNRSFLWAKSVGAQTQTTNNLVNLSYGVLQTVNDIQALFSAGNFIRSVGARYAWTIGGRALSKVQGKVVPQGGGPVGRGMRVLAGRQSKKILSSISSNFFVKTEMSINNVVNMEKKIKNDLAKGKGIARQWAMLTAAKAISTAPDPYSVASEIMGRSSMKGGRERNPIGDSSAINTRADTFRYIFGESASVIEAQHYQKYLVNGRNPNDLLTGYREKLIRETNDDHLATYVQDIKTGELGNQKQLVEKVRKQQEKALGTPQKNEYPEGSEIPLPDELGLDVLRSQDRKIFTMLQESSLNNNLNNPEFFEYLEKSQLDYTGRFDAYFDLNVGLNNINKARTGKGTKIGGYHGVKSDVLRLAHKNDKGIEQFMDLGRKIAGHSNTGHGAGKLIDIALGTKGFGGHYREDAIPVFGNKQMPIDLFQNGKLNPLYSGTHYEFRKISNNPKDPNFVPSRADIQRAIHIEQERYKLKNAFLQISVSFGGKRPGSKFADLIRDAQHIEFGGQQSARVLNRGKFGVGQTSQSQTYRHTYPRTLFMHNAAYNAAKQLNMNVGIRQPKTFRTKLGHKFQTEVKQDMTTAQKRNAFNLVLDRRTKELLDAEINIRQKRTGTGRVNILDAYESVLNDPQGTRYQNNAKLRNSDLLRESLLKLTGGPKTTTKVVFDEGGNPRTIIDKYEELEESDFKSYLDRLDEVLRNRELGGIETFSATMKKADQIWQRNFRTRLNEVLGAVGAEGAGDDGETWWFTRFPADMARRANVRSAEDILLNIESKVLKERFEYIKRKERILNETVEKSREKIKLEAMEVAKKRGKSQVDINYIYQEEVRKKTEQLETDLYIQLNEDIKTYPMEEVWAAAEEAELDRLRSIFGVHGQARRGKKITVGDDVFSLSEYMENLSESLDRTRQKALEEVADELDTTPEIAVDTIEYQQRIQEIDEEYQATARAVGINLEIQGAGDLTDTIIELTDPTTGETYRRFATGEEAARTDLEGLEGLFIPDELDNNLLTSEAILDTENPAFGTLSRESGLFGNETLEKALELLTSPDSQELKNETRKAIKILRNMKIKPGATKDSYGGGGGVKAEGKYIFKTQKKGRGDSRSTLQQNNLNEALGNIAGLLNEKGEVAAKTIAMYLQAYSRDEGGDLEVTMFLDILVGNYVDYELPAGQEFITRSLHSIIMSTRKQLDKKLTIGDFIAINDYFMDDILNFKIF